MKKLFILALLILTSSVALAQLASTVVTNGSGNPAGACTSGSEYVDSATGAKWTCTASAWARIPLVIPGPIGSTTPNTGKFTTITETNLLISNTAPTIAGAGCGGSGATIASNNGTAAFTINTGTAPTAGGCTVTLPTATTAWNCYPTDLTTTSATVFLQKQTSGTTTTAVLQNFSTTPAAAAPVANDIYQVSCFAR